MEERLTENEMWERLMPKLEGKRAEFDNAVNNFRKKEKMCGLEVKHHSLKSMEHVSEVVEDIKELLSMMIALEEVDARKGYDEEEVFEKFDEDTKKILDNVYEKYEKLK